MEIVQAEQKRKIVLELILFINKELYKEEKISYKIFKTTEENILKKLR